MSCLAFVALIASAAAQGPTSSTMLPMVPQVFGAAQGGISVGNSAAQLGGRLTSQGSVALMSSAKQLVDALAALRAAALRGSVDVFKQAMDIGGRATANIPVVGAAVGMSTNAMKTGAELVNNLGQNAINTKQKLMNIKLDVIDGVVQAGAGAFMNAANTSAAVASQGVKDAAQTVNEAVSSGGAAIGSANSAIYGAVRDATAPMSTTAKPPMFNPDIDLFYT